MDDEHAAKFAEMQKYIPFLESMEKRLENAGDDVKTKAAQLSKIKSLKGLLLSKKKKMKYDNLLKCEQVLMKLYSKVEKTDFQPSKNDNLKDNTDTTRNSNQPGSKSTAFSDNSFGSDNFDADELNRCREKLKSITKLPEALQDRLTMSTDKTLSPALGDYKSKTYQNKMTLDLYYDSLSESDDNNAITKAIKGPRGESSASFGRNNSFSMYGNNSSLVNYRQRSRSIEPGPSEIAMQCSRSLPSAKPRIYTRVLKSPERRRSRTLSKSPPKLTRSEKHSPFARNDHLYPSERSDEGNSFPRNENSFMSPLNILPRSEIILTSPQGAGFYNRRSPMTALSGARRSKSTSRKDINAVQKKKYTDNSISPQANNYSSTRIDKPSPTLPVGAGFYKRRSPKRVSHERRSRSTTKKDTYDDKISVSPRTEKKHISPRDKLVASPHFPGSYDRQRSPKKLLNELTGSCEFNREIYRKDKSMSKGSDSEKKKNRKKTEKNSYVENCETEREMELLRHIRSQIVSELNATNVNIDFGKLTSKKSLRREKKKKARAKVDVEEGEICDQYDELYDDLISPDRVADESQSHVLSGNELSKETFLLSQLNTSGFNITRGECTETNVSKRFNELDLLPAKSSDTYTEKDKEIKKLNPVNEDKNDSVDKPKSPQVMKEGVTNADELDEFFCEKLVEIRRKLAANKEAKQRVKDDIKINLLPEKEKKKTENMQVKKSEDNEEKAFPSSQEPTLLDIVLEESQSLETMRKSAIKKVDKKTKDPEKTSMAESVACGVSQSDILTALNSEIMMEKINIPEIATGLVPIKSNRKDISDSTPISKTAEGDKKRRISLETYKEKIAPFVVPSVKDESDDTSRSSQNEYEDHVNLISRALTAKEYERFQSILKSTIDDNILDPEAKLSLKTPNQKSINDKSKDQSIDDIFDTSKLLPEDLGPQSPDEELVFCDDDESPTPTLIPPDPVSININAPLQNSKFSSPVQLQINQIVQANDIDMRKSSVLPVPGNRNASHVNPGPSSEVDFFNQQFRSTLNNECTVPSGSDNKKAPSLFTYNKDPRKKNTGNVIVQNANTNINSQLPYRGVNDVRSRMITEHGYNSSVHHTWNRNSGTDSVLASPNMNSFDQNIEEITHFGANNLQRNSYDHNPSNFIGNRAPIHDRGYFQNFPKTEMGSISNVSPFGDHARESNSKASSCWRRGNDSAVAGDAFSPSGTRFVGQSISYGKTNYPEHSDGHSPSSDNIGYKHDDSRQAYSSDWNHSTGQYGTPNSSSRGIRDQSKASHYSETVGRFGLDYTPSGMDRAPENIRCTDGNAPCLGRNLGHSGYDYPQPFVGRERTPGRDVNREMSVGRSLNREPSLGRSFNRDPSVGRDFDRDVSIREKFHRETSVGRVLHQESSIVPTFRRESSVGRALNREPSVGRPFIREQSIGRTFKRDMSVGRTLHREPSVGRVLNREQSVGRTLKREQSVGRTFTREPSIGRTLTREFSVGRTLNNEQSIGRTYNREPSIGRVFNREPSVGRVFNREPSVGRTFERDPSTIRSFNREPSLGRSLNADSNGRDAFKREPSIGRVLNREQSVGRNLDQESTLGRPFNREPSVGRMITREPSVGKTLHREPSIGRAFNRERSVGRTTKESTSASHSTDAYTGRDRDSKRSFERGRSTSRSESIVTRSCERRSPSSRNKNEFDSSRDTRSRRELYDQQKASFPKEKYSRDPRLARDRGRDFDKDKTRRRHTDYKTTNRHSKSPKGFVYTKDNLAKGFSGHSGIGNYKIPKIKRETIPEPDSSDVLIDTNNPVRKLNDDVDEAASTLDAKQDVDMRVAPTSESTQGLTDVLMPEVNIEDSNLKTTTDVNTKSVVETPELDKTKARETETEITSRTFEEIGGNSTDLNSSHQNEEKTETVDNITVITSKITTCSGMGHTDKIITNTDHGFLYKKPVSNDLANDQVPSSKEGIEVIHIKKAIQNSELAETHSTQTINRDEKEFETDTLPENRLSKDKQSEPLESRENLSDIIKEKSDCVEPSLNPNSSIAHISSEEILVVTEVKRNKDAMAEDENAISNENHTTSDSCDIENELKSNDTNSLNVEAESTHVEKLLEEVSNVLPDSTIQFGNETEASFEEIPDSTNNVGTDTKSSEEHVTADTFIHQTGSRKPEPDEIRRVGESCRPIDALGSILSILTDKSKIKEILSLLGENSSTSEKIKRKLAKLTEIESDDDEDETSTHQDGVPDTLPPKPEKCANVMNKEQIDQNYKIIDTERKSEQHIQDLVPEKDIMKSAATVSLEEVTEDKEREGETSKEMKEGQGKQPVAKRAKGKLAKNKLAKNASKTRGQKKNVSKKVIVKKRITRQSVAIKGSNVLKSPGIKKGKVSKLSKPKKKRLDELQKLQVDIREMFISDDVLSVTGIRNCRINKLTDTIDTAALKKDTVLPISPPPLQKVTKLNKKLRQKSMKNDEYRNTLENKVDENRTPFVVIKGINPEIYKKAKQAAIISEDTKEDKLTDRKKKTKKKPGPKSRTFTTANASANKTIVSLKEKAKDKTQGTVSEISIVATPSNVSSNSSDKPVVLRPGPKSKKLLCLQNMLQQNQDTIAVDEIQDIILGLRDNSNQTIQNHPEQPSSTDSEDEALSTLANRRTQDDLNPGNKTCADPIPIITEPESPVAEIKSVDENYCFDSLHSEYDCKLCQYNGDEIVRHYKDCHPHDEILISRIRPAIIKDAIQQSLTLDLENLSTCNTNNTYTRFQCRFCLKSFCNVDLETLFWHVVTLHTGEYDYDCLLCTDDMVKDGECKQASLFKPQPPDDNAKYLTGYVCGLCSFTQVAEKNVKDHITLYHKTPGIKIHAINLCNVSITSEHDTETNELFSVTDMLIERNLQSEKRMNSSSPTSRDHEVLEERPIDGVSTVGAEQNMPNKNILESSTTMMNVGSSPIVPTKDGFFTIKSELQKESSSDWNTNKIGIISRTGTRRKKIQEILPSTVVRSDEDMTIKVGSIGIRNLQGGVVEYCCNVSTCLYRCTLLITFRRHLLNVHPADRWNGDCAVCKQGVNGEYLLTEELEHLIHAHMDDLDSESIETSNNEIEAVPQTDVAIQEEVQVDSYDDIISAKNIDVPENQTATPRKYINVRPFSDLAGSNAGIFATEISNIQSKASLREYNMNTDTDCEASSILSSDECRKHNNDTQIDVEAEIDLLSVPRIQEVISLNSAQSGQFGRTSPLASIASSWLQGDKSEENTTVHEIDDNIIQPTSSTSNDVLETSKQPEEVPSEIITLKTPTSLDKEAGNSTTTKTTWKPLPNTDAAAHPVFAAKSPKVARKMMVAKKQVHPFKCGGRFCSFTTHDTSAFSAHLSAHEKTAPGVRSCVYCPFEASAEVRALMQHVFAEHAHCQFACVYCPYVSTSSILVEMHRTGAHPDKAPAVLRLHAAHSNVLTAGSRGALPRSEAVLPYVCKQRATCKFQCLTSAQFVSHLAEHKHTQFVCSKCAQTFPRTSHLIRHLRQHGLCLYQCTYCVFGADAELDMLKHISKEHPMRRAQAYLRHVSSNSVESDRGGLPLVNMEKKFNGKIQICESKYTEDPIAEAEAADKLQSELETKTATEFLTNQSIRQETPVNAEIDSLSQQSSADLIPCISFVTSISNIMTSDSTTKFFQPTNTVENTTESSKGSLDVEEHPSAKPAQKISKTSPRKVQNVKKTVTLQVNDISKRSSNMRTESIICLDSDGEDNSENNMPDSDPIALDTMASDTPSQGVEQNIKPLVIEQKVIEKTDPGPKTTSIITLSDDEIHAQVVTSDILIPAASTSDAPQSCSNQSSVGPEGLTKNKMIVDSTLLFRCNKCDMSTRAAYNFSMHLTKCYSKTEQSISCYHCQAIAANGHELIIHLIEHHSDSKLYKCGVCHYVEWTEARFLNHMKGAHSSNTVIPIDSDSQIIVLEPKKRRRRGPKPGTKMGPKSKVKDKFKSKLAISDSSDLPRTPIVTDSMYCVKCGFDTKVTSNMARHLHSHESQLPVASSEPVNPVPHLESNEMHFDKMTNLAASSNMGRATEKTLPKEKPRPGSARSQNISPSNYPRYVQDHERYVCGAIGCAYLSLDEDMLKNHWETLHPQDTHFKCPHCPADQQLNNDKPLTSARIGAHLKMHDSRMYVCSRCPYYHYHKHYVERHVTDKHSPADGATLQCLREPPGLSSSSDDAAKGIPTMDLKPYCCGFCSFKTMLRADIIEHCNKVHNARSQYKCGSCSFNHANEQNIKKHQSLYHAGSLALKVITVYFKANRPSTDEMDGSPSWWKQRKRGSMEEPAGSPKRMKSSESTAFKSTESISLQDATAVNLDLVKEEPFENLNTIQVCDKSLTNANAEQEPEIAVYTFVCPLCTTHKVSDVEAMKSHLYEELNYRKWGCNVCSYKSFERDRLVKHIMVEHGVVQEPKSLPEDQRIEQWISTVISMQENHTKTSEKNKTIVYLMRILPRIDNNDNQSQDVVQDSSSKNQSASDPKSITKEGRKKKSLDNQLILSSAGAQALINTHSMFRFPKVDNPPKNLASKTRTDKRPQSKENESRSLVQSQKIDDKQGKSDNRLTEASDALPDNNQAIRPAQSTSQELVAIFGSLGESKGYRFVCPKCHYGVDNRDGIKRHLETELNMHVYKCDLCHLKFNSITMYVKHYAERHNGGVGPNKLSTTRMLAQAEAWIDLLIHTQGLSISAYISTHGPDPAPDYQPAKATEGRKRRHSLVMGSQSDGDDSSDEERLVIIEPPKQQLEQSKTDNVSSNHELASSDVSSDDQSPSKHSRLDPPSKVRNYKCPHCYFVTRYSTCLVDHISRHFYDRPFKCGYCEFKHYRKQVKEHIKRVHPNEVPKVIKVQFPDTPLVVDLEIQKNTGQNVIKVCLICEASLLPQQVTSHFNMLHPDAKKVLVVKGETVYRCNDCAFMLQTLDETTEHFRSVHPRCRVNYMLHRIGGGEPQSYLCNHCSNVFPHMKDLHCHHERAHPDLDIDFADLGPSKSTSGVACSITNEDADATTSDSIPVLTMKKTIRCVARKSTTKLPPSVRAYPVARKSTTKLPFNIESFIPFSAYGRTPDTNIGHLTTKMPFYGTLMPFTVQKLKDIINISPVVLVEDIGKKTK